jgi:dTDP-L-rhamnose 4-epimerase
MRVLVTGGAGFIGSHTAEALLARGYDVRVLDALQPRVHPEGWPRYLPPEIERLEGDVRDPAVWRRALEGVRVVYHLAAYQDYMPDFSTFFAVNTVSTALLFETIVADRLPIEKVILASSQAVYGEGKYRCPPHGTLSPGPRPLAQLAAGRWEVLCPQCREPLAPLPIDEAAVNPHTAYGISKYALEMAGFALGRRYGIPTVVLRYSIVQGPRNSFNNAYSGVCRIFTLRLLHGRPPVIYEDGLQERDYVHIADVVRANLLVLDRQEADFEAFNVGGQRAVTVLEMARLVAEACGRDISPEIPGAYRVGDTRHTVSSSEKLGRLGWRPEIPVERIVRDYVAWVREQPEAQDSTDAAEAAMQQAGVLRHSEPVGRQRSG